MPRLGDIDVSSVLTEIPSSVINTLRGVSEEEIATTVQMYQLALMTQEARSIFKHEEACTAAVSLSSVLTSNVYHLNHCHSAYIAATIPKERWPHTPTLEDMHAAWRELEESFARAFPLLLVSHGIVMQSLLKGEPIEKGQDGHIETVMRRYEESTERFLSVRRKLQAERKGWQICPGCGTWFQPVDKRQKFHDKKCASADRQRRHRINAKSSH